MIIEFCSQKNHITSVSQYDSCTEAIKDKAFTTISDTEMDWRISLSVAGDVWIKYNFIEPIELYEINFTAGGPLEYWEPGYVQPWDSVVIEHSLDDKNWYILEPKGLNDWSGYSNIFPVYVRIRFTNVIAGFHFDECHMFGNEEILINDELISLTSKRYYPQRYFEQNVMMPYSINDYLVMLEGDTIEPFYKVDECTTTVYYIGNGDNGGINVNPINTIPLNGYGASVGPGKAIINRIDTIDADYNVNGRFIDFEGNLTRYPICFNSIIECITGSHIDLTEAVSFVWTFNDPFSTPDNPNDVVVSSYGEICHKFSALGTYDIQFVITIDGTTIEDTLVLEIMPGLYVPEVDNSINNIYDGTIVTIHGLTSWSTGSYSLPEIILRDAGETLSPATLTDNGDGTFTASRNGETNDCRIRIWDDFYEQYVYLDVTFLEPVELITDSNENTIFDSSSNQIEES